MAASTVISPFRYYPGNWISDCNNSSISYKHINKFILDKKVTLADIEILKIIFKYKYLNRKNLEIAIDKSLHIDDNEILVSYKKRLSKLCDYGVLVRYYYSYSIDNGIDMNNETRTPYIYTLSRGAVAFLKAKYRIKADIDSYCVFESSELVFNKLVINQLLISITSNELFSDLKNNIICYDPLSKSKFNLYSTFLMTTKNNEKSFVIAEPVRRIMNWPEYIVGRINKINGFFSTKKFTRKKLSPIIIFICEDDLHVEHLFNALARRGIKLKALVLFSTDVRLLNSGLDKNILKCRNVEDRTEIVQHLLNS